MSETISTNKVFGTGLTDLSKLQQESKNPILVKFVTPHCPACRTLAPVIQQLVADYDCKLHLVTIDMTEEPEFAMELGVRSAPTVVLFQQSTVVEQIAGLQPKKVYTEVIQRIVQI